MTYRRELKALVLLLAVPVPAALFAVVTTGLFEGGFDQSVFENHWNELTNYLTGILVGWYIFGGSQ